MGLDHVSSESQLGYHYQITMTHSVQQTRGKGEPPTVSLNLRPSGPTVICNDIEAPGVIRFYD